MNGDVRLVSDTIRGVGVDTSDFTPNLSTIDTLDDIPLANRVFIWALANKTVTGGVFRADPFTTPNITGVSAEVIFLYKDSGVETTSYLFDYIDTATGLPITPSGGPINIIWDTGPYGIFAI